MPFRLPSWLQQLHYDTDTIQQAAYAAGSLKNIQSHVRSYLLFCFPSGHHHQELSIPHICNYLVFLARTLTYGSIKNHFSSLHCFFELLHIQVDLRNDFFIHLTIPGIQRNISTTSQSKLPIAPTILLKLYGLIDQQSSLDIAAALVHSSLFSISEICFLFLLLPSISSATSHSLTSRFVLHSPRSLSLGPRPFSFSSVNWLCPSLSFLDLCFTLLLP